MARTWLSIRVELVEDGGHDTLWPRPGRIFAAARNHTFATLATGIDDAFARWDRAHLHQSGRPIRDRSASPDCRSCCFPWPAVDLEECRSGFGLRDGWGGPTQSTVFAADQLGFLPDRPSSRSSGGASSGTLIGVPAGPRLGSRR